MTCFKNICAFFIILSAFHISACQSELDPAEVLEKVTSLRNDLCARNSRISETGNKLNFELNAVKLKIQVERSKATFSSAQEALKNKIINSNLLSMQKAIAYLEIIEEEKNNILNAQSELDHLESQARLDNIMAEGIQDKEKIKQIIAKVDTVINRVEPNADKPITTMAEGRLQNLEKIWQDNFQSKVSWVIPNPQTYGNQNSFSSASWTCANLVNTPFKDWRVPTEDEVYSITELTAGYVYWTQTQCVGGNREIITCQQGLIVAASKDPSSRKCACSKQANSAFVLCVR